MTRGKKKKNPGDSSRDRVEHLVGHLVHQVLALDPGPPLRGQVGQAQEVELPGGGAGLGVLAVGHPADRVNQHAVPVGHAEPVEPAGPAGPAGPGGPGAAAGLAHPPEAALQDVLLLTLRVGVGGGGGGGRGGGGGGGGGEGGEGGGLWT